MLDDETNDTALIAGTDAEGDPANAAEDAGNPFETDTRMEVNGRTEPNGEPASTEATTAVPGITNGVEAELCWVAISISVEEDSRKAAESLVCSPPASLMSTAWQPRQSTNHISKPFVRAALARASFGAKTLASLPVNSV